MDSIACAAAWRTAYARQSLSDFVVFEHLCLIDDIPECQRLHYLQMALEKAAKAFFWSGSGSKQVLSKVNTSHDVVETHLLKLYMHYQARLRRVIPGAWMREVRLFCREIDRLAPANDRQLRPDNCEYPWPVLDATGEVERILSPLDHEFSTSSLRRRPGPVRDFLKVVRSSIQQMASTNEAVE